VHGSRANARWSYPDDGYGDCEDYVLLKRRMLTQSGWPREALLVTVVRNEKDEGHAVLTVTGLIVLLTQVLIQTKSTHAPHESASSVGTVVGPRQSEQRHPALVGDSLSIRETPIASRPQRLGFAQQSAAGDRYGYLSLNT
jgi:hypothetical protein